MDFKIKKVLVTPKGEIVEMKKSPKLPDDLPRKTGMLMKLVTLADLNTTRTRRVKDERPNGHWEFPEQLGGKYFGFIYLIKNKVNGRMYIGKKQFEGSGKVNRGQETNWRSYTSSCKALQEDIEKMGKDSFEFHVLEQYRIRGSLGFAETWSLMCVEAPANRDKWYNMLVNKISWTVKEGISQRHKQRIKEITGMTK